MKILYIIHADFELPGIIRIWAEKNRCVETMCRPFAGESLPNVKDYDLLILMGGPQSPLDITEAPYLEDEIALVKTAIKAEIPVLGFCLGAQLIGEALGARTERSPYKEVGVFPIDLTKEGLEDPILKGLPKQFPVVHWHNDMPGITSTSKILAQSKGCPRQIVCYSPSIYGFQCHLEPMKHNIEAMITHCPDDLKPQQFVQSAQEILNHNFEEMNQIMLQIMNNLIAANNDNKNLIMESM